MRKHHTFVRQELSRLDDAALGKLADACAFGTVANPIRVMTAEHDSVGELIAEIGQLTSDTSP